VCWQNGVRESRKADRCVFSFSSACLVLQTHEPFSTFLSYRLDQGSALLPSTILRTSSPPRATSFLPTTRPLPAAAQPPPTLLLPPSSPTPRLKLLDRFSPLVTLSPRSRQPPWEGRTLSSLKTTTSRLNISPHLKFRNSPKRRRTIRPTSSSLPEQSAFHSVSLLSRLSVHPPLRRMPDWDWRSIPARAPPSLDNRAPRDWSTVQRRSWCSGRRRTRRCLFFLFLPEECRRVRRRGRVSRRIKTRSFPRRR